METSFIRFYYLASLPVLHGSLVCDYDDSSTIYSEVTIYLMGSEMIRCDDFGHHMVPHGAKLLYGFQKLYPRVQLQAISLASIKEVERENMATTSTGSPFASLDIFPAPITGVKREIKAALFQAISLASIKEVERENMATTSTSTGSPFISLDIQLPLGSEKRDKGCPISGYFPS